MPWGPRSSSSAILPPSGLSHLPHQIHPRTSPALASDPVFSPSASPQVLPKAPPHRLSPGAAGVGDQVTTPALCLTSPSLQEEPIKAAWIHDPWPERPCPRLLRCGVRPHPGNRATEGRVLPEAGLGIWPWSQPAADAVLASRREAVWPSLPNRMPSGSFDGQTRQE